MAASGEAGTRLRAASAQFGSGLQLRQRLFLHESGGTTYLFWPLRHRGQYPGQPRRRTSRCRPRSADIPCGYVPEGIGLRALPAAARTAESLAALIRPNDAGPLSADAAWARLANQNLQDAGLDLAADQWRRHWRNAAAGNANG